ncbi:unnamed protein product [Spirodela intermedia]|uniref:Uncharacterized protein n=1 Tax=Spirodela intermedia TaxID=51605 RepID=A0A7I8IUT2_SPIIN|nr:unnamed protein product [Spirodela intermedia]CAA6660727.1 unnamed protein product [Spirodela intermedia]
MHTLNSCPKLTSLADELLSPPAFPRKAGQVLHAPSLDEELEHQPLGDCREVLEEVVVTTIVHQMGRHGDLLLHHILKCNHRAVRVYLKELLHDLCVRHLVSLLLHVSVLLGAPGSVSMGNKGRPLLEGGVLNCLLNLSHVDSATQIEIFIQKIAMPILFRGPCSCPDGPRSGARTCLIPNAVKGVQHCLIRGKRLLCDHISHQADKIIIGDLLCPLSQKSCGCQHFSTGFRCTRMLSFAQPSNDLKISIF